MFTGAPGKDSEEYKKLLADLNLTALAQRVGDAPLGDFGDNISGGGASALLLCSYFIASTRQNRRGLLPNAEHRVEPGKVLLRPVVGDDDPGDVLPGKDELVDEGHILRV